MTERRSRRRPGENREYLREAGLIEFGLSGYHGTATARIAARAGVPQPHVYASFKTKQELFLACVEASAGRLSDSVGDERDEALILQAVAAAQDPELAPALRALLSDLRTRLGEPGFLDLLGRASAFLLSARAAAADS